MQAFGKLSSDKTSIKLCKMMHIPYYRKLMMHVINVHEFFKFALIL